MGVCTICGKAEGFLRSKHAECESPNAGAPPYIAVVQDRPASAFGQSIYSSLSEKIGDPMNWKLAASKLS